MASTVEERERRSQLTQSRVKIKESSSSTTSGPGVVINFAEIMIVLGAAITVDIIDALDLTGIGSIIARLIDVPTLGALWLWRLMKTGPKKDHTFAILMSFLIELSPIGMVPTWTIFVLYVFAQDTRVGKATIDKVKKITKIKKSK